jgi:YHS domain-containing protein
MAQAMDVVCGMMVETSTAPAEMNFEATTYYFCSTDCLDLFAKDPAHYASEENVDRLSKSVHNTRFPTPRFGSAGSGGAEFESVPDMDKRGVD